MNVENLSQEQIKIEQANFITKVYGWMSLALILTGLIAYWVSVSPQLAQIVLGNQIIYYGLMIVELICVIVLSATIDRISSTFASFIFFGYAALNGLTLAAIFLVYTSESIATTFFVTAATFGVMSAYGYYTKKDLTTIGNLAYMALFGLIIASVVNLFVHNEMLYWITTYAGVLIFVGLTAYDTQKIKNMNIIGNEDTEEDKKETIIGALALYLDFINLFLYLLRLLGKRR